MKSHLLASSLLLTAAAVAHEVSVYSYVTDAGKTIAAAVPGRPVGFVVSSGGYQELGQKTRGERPLSADQIESLLKPVLEKAGFQPEKEDEPQGKVILRYTWGCMNPIINEDATGREIFVNQAEMLSLVGANALAGDPLNSLERREIMNAARDCRYFLIVAAYDLAAHVHHGRTQLLWKTQMSICSDRLSQRAAFPMLVAAGSPLFGRATLLPRRITLEVKGTLNLDVARP